jgi:dipeptidyl aminopeptidase/acylaminoacyl peptidase
LDNVRFIAGVMIFGWIALTGVAVGAFMCLTIVLFIPGVAVAVASCAPMSWWLMRRNKKTAEKFWDDKKKELAWYEQEDENEDQTPPWQV